MPKQNEKCNNKQTKLLKNSAIDVIIDFIPDKRPIGLTECSILGSIMKPAKFELS